MTFEWRPYARPDGVPRQTKTTRSKALKTQNQADDVACERPHQNHDGLYLVVLFDLRRLTPGGLRMTAEGRMHGSDVAVECAIGLGVVTAAVHCRLPFASHTVSATWHARE